MPQYTADQYTNSGLSTIAGGAGGNGTSLGSGDTTLYVASGDGNARFPASPPYTLALGNLNTSYELVKCTARTNDTLTITRGVEGTSAQTWGVGVTVQLVLTAGGMADLWAAINDSDLFYNVRFYGAKGDGVTDDTAAIQATITACENAGSGVVYLPTVTASYLISAPLVVSSDNVRIKGDGRGSQLQATSAMSTAPMIWVKGPGLAGQFRHGTRVSDLLLVNTVASSALGIEFDSTYYATIERVDIEGVYSIDIFLTASSSNAFGAYTHVRDCHLGAVNGGAGSAGVGIKTNNHEFTIVEDNVINWFNNTGGVGILSQNSSNIIRNNTFDACDTGIELYFCDDNIVDGNAIDRSYTYAIHNIGAKRSKVVNNNFLDYSGHYSSSAMIYVENTGTDNVYANNIGQTGKPWVYALYEVAGPTGPSLYVNNDFAGYGVVRSNGILRGNLSYNPVGYLTAPTMPSSGTALTNPFGVDCTIYFSGGTVNNILINGQTIGLTSGPVRLMATQTLTIDYSSQPVWWWFGE